MLIFAVVMALLGSGAIYGTLLVLKKRSATSIGAERQQYIDQIEIVTKEIEELLQHADGYAARGQYEALSSRVDQVKADLQRENGKLAEFEEKLDRAQSQVEEKEGHQQELKTAKEEDEAKLEKLLSTYTEISDEAISLEQRLAQSMKNLDSILEELDLSDDQRQLFDEVSEALSQAGANLRNLLMEYEQVKQRLDLLREQHRDLEDEYTKLVEQQLGT